MPSVSVIIPARNDATALSAAVASVEAQIGAEIVDIVIAVGPSDDGTEQAAADLAAANPKVHVVPNPSGRTPNALNAAIAASRGDVIARLDAHAVLPPHYVAHALETMTETGAANVGAIQLPVGTSATGRAVAAAMRSRLGSGGVAYRHSTAKVAVDTAYLDVFRRSALEQVGGFSERFVRNQDSELNIRLRKAGHQVWLDPRMVVAYAPRSSFRRLWSQYWQYGWWRARTVATHPESLRLRQLFAPALVVGLPLAGALGVLQPVFFMIPVLYLALVLGTAVFSRNRLAVLERPRVAAALVIMHMSWGLAFLASTISQWFGPELTPSGWRGR